MPSFRLGWIAALLAVSLSAASAGAANRCKLLMSPPIPVDMEDQRPHISASINGDSVKLLVDTSSYFGFLSHNAVSTLNLPVSSAPFFLRNAKSTIAPMLATAKTFTVAGISVHDAAFLVEDSPQNDEVGVLGQNLLRIADVDYDLANGALRFVKPDHCGGQVLAYWAHAQPVSAVDLHWTSLEQPFLIVKASVNGQHMKAIFDTASTSTMLSLSAAKRAGITPESPGVVDGGMSGLAKRTIKVWVAPVAKFDIGGEAIEHTHFLIGDVDLSYLGADMVLGTDFFLAHHIYIAYSQNKLYFTYNGGPVFDLNAHSGQIAAASKGLSGNPPASGPVAGNTTQANSPAPQSAAPALANSQQTAATEASNMPTDAAGFMRRGMAHTARRQYSLAIGDLTRACDLDPTNADCRYQRGLAYSFNGQPQPALADFNAAIELRPGDFEAHLARARLELAQHSADAHIDLDAVDRLAPEQADLRIVLAGLYNVDQEYGSSIHQHDLWIKYHPGDVNLLSAFTTRCWAEGAANTSLDRAMKDCNKALELMSKTAPASVPAIIYSDRGLVCLRQGRIDDALADLDTALRLQPDLAVARYERGLVELQKGLKSQGQADLVAAEAKKPGLAKRFAGMGLKP